MFDGEGDVTAKQHVAKFEDFIDLEEVDYPDVKLWLFAQSLSGEAKKWFKDLPNGSIANFQVFQNAFLDRWDDKQNPLQLLSQYNGLKKGGFESVHEFSSRFMRVYNSILEDIKPSATAAKLHYAGAFDNDFAFSLRERKSVSLATMFTDALEVEANMMASGKMKQRDIDRRKTREENMPSTSSSATDIKFEMMLKTMEKLMDRLIVDNRSFNREQADPQIRNPNFRRPNPPMPPQNRQRDMRNPRNQEEQ